MSKACKVCGGRGRWQEAEYNGDDLTTVWHECADCKGSGVEQDPEAGDDYDVGGDSYAADE